MALELQHVAEISRRNDSIYKALPGSRAIRLLLLGHGEDRGSSSYTLSTFLDYRHAPSYDALSYCWGNATDLVEVMCDGQPFLLTQNLLTALRQLQSPDSDTQFLWVDAVCINQHDGAERSQQVSIMKQIYSFASRVLVWLGPSDMHIVKAIGVIRKATEECRTKHYSSSSNSDQVWRRTLCTESGLAQVATTLAGEWQLDSLWSDIMPIFECPWFRRIWVIQEIQSCDETWLLSGDIGIEWCLVALVARAIMHRHYIMDGDKTTFSFARRSTWKQYAIPQADFMAHRVMRTASDVPFLRVLHQSRCFKSTDPRDKIFSMLQQPVHVLQNRTSLLEESERLIRRMPTACSPSSSTSDNITEPPLQYQALHPSRGKRHLDLMPDYNKSVHAVYFDLAAASIAQTGKLDILSYRLNGQKHVPDIPAWVPHWSEDTTGWIIPLPMWQYNATADLPCEASVRSQNIDLSGIRLGTVSQVSWTIATCPSADVANACSRSESSYLYVDNLDAVARTMLHDQRPGAHSPDSEATRARGADCPEANFADFASWVLARSRASIDNFYCSTRIHYCDFCNKTLVDSDVGTPEPTQWYGCGTCEGGDMDICESCYRKGKTCYQPLHHRIGPISCAGIYVQHDDSQMRRLRAAEPLGSAKDFFHTLRETMVCRIWFSTTRENIGSGPMTMQTGDVVAVLFGARVPFVLRPTKEEGHYYLVGDCYLDGMMDGEAVRMWRSGELAEETFKLC